MNRNPPIAGIELACMKHCCLIVGGRREEMAVTRSSWSNASSAPPRARARNRRSMNRLAAAAGAG